MEQQRFRERPNVRARLLLIRRSGHLFREKFLLATVVSAKYSICRDIVAIAFDPATEQVASVNKYSLKDGKVFALNDRETPTRGREMTILEQLLGNVGRGGMLPRDEEERVPGNRPGDR